MTADGPGGPSTAGNEWSGSHDAGDLCHLPGQEGVCPARELSQASWFIPLSLFPERLQDLYVVEVKGQGPVAASSILTNTHPCELRLDTSLRARMAPSGAPALPPAATDDFLFWDATSTGPQAAVFASLPTAASACPVSAGPLFVVKMAPLCGHPTGRYICLGTSGLFPIKAAVSKGIEPLRIQLWIDVCPCTRGTPEP